MSKKKAKVKLTNILEAGIEDAFDECKTPDEMTELTKLIVEKMNKLYWTRKNSREDDVDDD